MKKITRGQVNDISLIEVFSYVVRGIVIFLPLLFFVLYEPPPKKVTCGTRGCGPYHEWLDKYIGDQGYSRLQLVGLGGVYSVVSESFNPDGLVMMANFVPWNKDTREIEKENFAASVIPDFYRIREVWKR